MRSRTVGACSFWLRQAASRSRLHSQICWHVTTHVTNTLRRTWLPDNCVARACNARTWFQRASNRFGAQRARAAGGGAYDMMHTTRLTRTAAPRPRASCVFASRAPEPSRRHARDTRIAAAPTACAPTRTASHMQQCLYAHKRFNYTRR